MTARETPHARPRATLLGTYCDHKSASHLSAVALDRATHHVGDVLLLADQGDVKHDTQGLGIGGKNDKLARAAVDSGACQS